MKNVDGLIQYYYQRRISGMEFSEIRHSLREQQHIADEDREAILKEVERRELVYHRARRQQRIAKFLYLTGIPLTAISLIFLYLNTVQKIFHSPVPGIGILALGCFLLVSGYAYQRNLISPNFSRLVKFPKRTST